MDQVICFETQQDECNMKGLYILIAAFILIPICWLRSFKYLAYVSMASNVFLVFALFIIVAYCLQNANEHPELSNDLNYLDLTAVPLFFGIAVFDFEGNGVVINLHASMKEPEKFDSVLKFCLVIYVTFLCVFSSIAYWSYGSELEDMVTLNLPHDNLTSMIQVFYCFGLLGSYPMQMMPVFEIIETASLYNRIPTMSSFRPSKRMCCRTSLVLMTAFGAMVVPKFGLFINLIGAFACTALAFILPVRIYDLTHYEEMSNRRKWMHRMLMCFGIICGLISFIMSVKDLAKAFSEGDAEVDEDAGAALAEDTSALINDSSESNA